MKTIRVIAGVAAFVALAVTSVPVFASESDEQIERAAKSSFVFKTYLKNDAVKVTSKDGAVTLTGTVSEEPSILLAQEAVSSLRGVKSVDNKLEIKGMRPAENSDGWIAARVKTVLFFHRSVSGIKTEVSVKDGVVTLSGEAKNSAQRDLTTEYAKDVEGVKDVKNKMSVANAPRTAKGEKETVGDKIDDASITSQVKMSLLFHRSTRVLKTHVETDNGVVVLTGTAGSKAEKDLVSKIVEDINGVTKVDNRMAVK